MTQTNENYIYSQQPFWGGWNIEELIGEGSFAKVYKLFKEEWGYKYTSALKVLTFPTKEMLHNISTLSISKEQYFEDSIQNIVSEIRLLYQLKGNSNIVAYEDHLVLKRENDFLFDILIRMEYLAPFSDYLKKNILTPKIIINLGMDICSAIDLCMTKNIIHRDIKEDNIFVSNDSKFKLGDFGVSKQLSELLLTKTKIGTPLYVAPEVLQNQDYDSKADIYSLGIVLYKLLNHGRFPFMPLFPKELKFSDTDIALNSRLSGKQLPEPYPQCKILSTTILKACSFNPIDRYKNGTEFKQDLFLALKSMDELEQKIGILTQKSNSSNENLKNIDSLENQPKTYANTILIEDTSIQKKEQSHNNFNQNSSNIINGGFCYKYYDSYYICNIYDNFKLLKFDNDFNYPTVILEDYPSFINIHNNVIYYSNGVDNETLYKCNLDGLEKTKLATEQVWDLYFFDNYLYYINGSDNFSIYKIKSNGSKREKIHSNKSAFLNYNSNTLFFCNIDDNNSIYSISLDDSNRLKKLVPSSSSHIKVQNNFIYYLNQNENFCLYRYNLDNSQSYKILNCKVKNFSINETSIFYINENNNIYKIDLNGKNNYLIIDSFCKNTQLYSDFLLYYQESPSKGLYTYNIQTKKSKELITNKPNKKIINGDWLYLQK